MLNSLFITSMLPQTF